MVEPFFMSCFAILQDYFDLLALFMRKQFYFEGAKIPILLLRLLAELVIRIFFALKCN